MKLERKVKLRARLVRSDGPLPAPLHVSFVWVDQVGEEIQAYLCDADWRGLREQIDAKGKETPPGEPVEVDLTTSPLQKIFLSQLAAKSLYETLGKIFGDEET